MIPYRLLLSSCNKPDNPQGIFTSNQMLGWGLYNEFSKLPHVTLAYVNSDMPESLSRQSPVDFTLLHCYFAAPIFDYMAQLRALTSRRIINFMELGLGDGYVDQNFTYLPWQSHWAPTEQVEFPFVGELLCSQTSVKLPHSILLDHSWPLSLLKGPQELWYDKLYKWLGPLKDSRKIGQLRRTRIDIDFDTNLSLKNESVNLQGRTLTNIHEGQIPIPDWVRSIPESCYPEYLERTAPYENFILTHPGSYEHSIIDMAFRGIKVLIPIQDDLTFVPKAIINRMGFPTFQTEKELLTLLETPNLVNRDFGTDMPEIVRRIDAYCQKEMQR